MKMPTSFGFRRLREQKNQRRQHFAHGGLHFECLEPRRLLAATNLGAIEGRVFVDLDGSGTFNAGEQLPGIDMELYLDDSNNVFDGADTLQPPGTTDPTDANGMYRFDGLTMGTYFVVQPAQNVAGRDLAQMVMGPVSFDMTEVMGQAGTPIDTFTTPQTVTDITNNGTPADSFQDLPGGEAPGDERDIAVNLTAAMAGDQIEARVIAGSLFLEQSAGAEGSYTLVYDGNDDSANVDTSGLSLDLTEGGLRTRLAFRLLANMAGDSAVITVQNAAETAMKTVPLLAGTNDYIIPFDMFTGDTGVFDNVGAITFAINSTVTGNDFTLMSIGPIGPTVKTENFIKQPQIDLELDKTVGAAIPNVGDDVTFTVTVTNQGPDPATNIDVRDIVPAGFTYVGGSIAGGDSQDESDPTGAGLLWEINSLASGANVMLMFDATVLAGGNVAAYTNSAQVTAADEMDADSTPNNNQPTEDDQDAAVVTPMAADLRLVKTVDDNTPNVGQNVTFTIALTNDGPNQATNVQVEDILPAGMTFVSDAPDQGSYDDGTGIWMVGDIADGATVNLAIMATVDTGGTKTNSAQVNASDQLDMDSTPDNDDPGEDDQDAALVTPQEADLNLSKTVNNNSPNVGDDVTFTITLMNEGPDTATNVEVEDLLPAGMTYVGDTPDQGSYNDATGVWMVGDLANGASVSLDITATVDTMGTKTNVAQVSASDQFDDDSTPNNDILSEDDQDQALLAPQVADLELIKTVDNADPNIGDNITFTIAVTNQGPDDATNVEVEDDLPAGLTYVSDAPDQGSYNEVTGIWMVGTIASGATVELDITAKVTALGTQINGAEVTASDQFDDDSMPNNDLLLEDDQDTAQLMAMQIDLALTKSVDDSSPNVGDNIVFTLTLSNTGVDDATNVSVRDILPPGLTYVGDTPDQGNYNDATGVWNLGTVASGASVDLDITASVDTAGTKTNTAEVIAADQTDIDSTPDNDISAEDDQDDADVTPQTADLSLEKTVDNAMPNVGDDVTFTVTLTNVGPNTATNVEVEDILPAGLTFVSATEDQGNYNDATGVWTVGDVANGAVLELEIAATVDVTTTQTNAAEVTASDQFDPDSTPNNDVLAEDDQDVAALMAMTADLSLTKSVSDTTPNIGDNVTFTISLTNSGPDTATNVSVEDVLPAGLMYVSDNPDQGNYINATGIWNVGDVPNGTTINLEIVAQVITTGTKTNVAQVNAVDQFDPDSMPDNDDIGEDDQELASLTPLIADLALSKSVSDAEPNVGDNVVFTIQLTNQGPDGATNVTVLDVLPGGLSFVSFMASQGAFNDATGIWTVGSLASGANAELEITASVDAAAAATNVARVESSDQFDDDSTPGNDDLGEDDQDAAIISPQLVDLQIIKVDAPEPTIAGNNLVYTLTVTNNGPSDATGVVVTDNLPGEVTFVDAQTTQGTTNHAGGIVTANIGNLASGATEIVTIEVNVDSSARGIINNTANVTSNESETNPGNNSDAEPTVIDTLVDLQIVKQDDPDPVLAGNTLVYTLLVTNNGPSDATNVEVTDVLPDEATFLFGTSTPGSVNHALGIVTADIGTLAPGATAIVTINASVSDDARGTISNTATVNATEPELIDNNNQDIEITTIDRLMSSISGYVFFDRNNDGAFGRGDEGISGVTIQLTGTDEDGIAVNRTTTTNSRGRWEFDNLLAGMYTVSEIQPAPFGDGAEDPGGDGIGNISGNDQFFFDLGAGENARNYAFGELAPNFSKRQFFASAF